MLNFSGFCRSLTVLKTRIVEPKLGLGRERWSVSEGQLNLDVAGKPNL